MKKTLAIVLALVMVLCMIPGMSAAITEIKTVTDKSYTIQAAAAQEWGVDVGMFGKNSAEGNTLTFKYNWEEISADQTGKWTEDTKMAAILVRGFDPELKDATDIVVTIDGKELKVAEDANSWTKEWAGYGKVANSVGFPVELTKAGYSDTYLVQVSGVVGTKKIVETAKISVVFKNTAEYKDVETAVITNVEAADKALLDAYIVGDKIYLDYVKDDPTAVGVKFTFADANKAAFTGVAYAYTNDSFAVAKTGDYLPTTYTESYEGWDGECVRLVDSAANFTEIGVGTDVTFKLETKANLYETKKYDVVVRTGIEKADPKGIYFAETTKTIAMGQVYAPVVVGVATGKPVDAEIAVGALTDEQVIDIDKNGNVIGTREGVAYITAAYTFETATGEKTYIANAQKIVVTLPGESIPELDPAAEVYYVTCRALNVRAGAGTSYKKVDLIHRGDAVKVVELKNGWAKLDNGTYVCAKYISK